MEESDFGLIAEQTPVQRFKVSGALEPGIPGFLAGDILYAKANRIHEVVGVFQSC
ncbi:hypothetical protein [Paraburkholderia sp. RL17-381-BIF-C]|jgi:hypothetical protein|uniref:hypothetical protein n=1 Tax=Paraburkholderia sp. RL17-381-BIF-C TaxID=3031635 RepID=UPI0038BABB27